MQEQFDQNQNNQDNQINDTDRPVSFNQQAKSQRKQVSTWLGVLIIILATLVLFGGAFTWQYFAKPQTQNLDSETAGPPSRNQQATADWKTYTNDEYGFEIKYRKILLQKKIYSPQTSV